MNNDDLREVMEEEWRDEAKGWNSEAEEMCYDKIREIATEFELVKMKPTKERADEIIDDLAEEYELNKSQVRDWVDDLIEVVE